MSWQSFKQKFELSNKDFFKWRQIINAVPREWKNLIENENTALSPPKSQHLLHLTRVIPLGKLTAKFCYILKILQIKERPTSQSTILTKIGEDKIDWEKAYLNARKCTVDSYCRNFHYKFALNILSLNDSLSKIKRKKDHTQMISESSQMLVLQKCKRNYYSPFQRLSTCKRSMECFKTKNKH